MKTLKTYKQGLAKVKREWLARRYDRAIAEADRMLGEWPDNPHLLVLWAHLVELQETEEGPPTLEDAKAAYQRAVELDSESPEPLIEFGHYLYALDDDAAAAEKMFSRAIRLCKSLLTEALVGKAKALDELGRKTEALECFTEAYWLDSPKKQEANGKASKAILDGIRELAQTE